MLDSILRFQRDPSPFPFERLPPELRPKIYEELLKGARKPVQVTKCVRRSGRVKCRLKDDEGCASRGQPIYHLRIAATCYEGTNLHLAILRANRAIHGEALSWIERNRVYDFGSELGAVLPFLRDLDEGSRRSIKGIQMDIITSKRPTIRPPWITSSNAKHSDDNTSDLKQICEYLKKEVPIQELAFNINVSPPKEPYEDQWIQSLVQLD